MLSRATFLGSRTAEMLLSLAAAAVVLAVLVVPAGRPIVGGQTGGGGQDSGANCGPAEPPT